MPVLAAVPETPPEKKNPNTPRDEPGDARKTYRLVAEAPEGPVAESFRNLRACLSLLGPEAERRVFLFTSAVPNDGKSFTSANYALARAQQGHRVLLSDGALRRENIHKIFLDATVDSEAKGETRGIVDYLIGGTSLTDATRPVLARDVDVTGGPTLVTQTLPPPPAANSVPLPAVAVLPTRPNC